MKARRAYLRSGPVRWLVFVLTVLALALVVLALVLLDRPWFVMVLHGLGWAHG